MAAGLMQRFSGVGAALILVMVVVAGLGVPAARAQGGDDLAALNAQVVQLYQAGKYAEATEIAKRSLVLAEKQSGRDHPDVGQSLNNLALLYESQGRYVEAEPLFKRSLALREKALGPDHPDVGTSLNCASARPTDPTSARLSRKASAGRSPASH